jgi:hypothetical protein
VPETLGSEMSSIGLKFDPSLLDLFDDFFEVASAKVTSKSLTANFDKSMVFSSKIDKKHFRTALESHNGIDKLDQK